MPEGGKSPAGNSIADDLARARAGDRAAFEKVYKMVEPKLHARARREAARNPGLDSSDLLQETWLRAWQRLSDLQGTTFPKFVVWLARIQRNVVIDRSRSGGAQKRHAKEVSVEGSQTGEAIGPTLKDRGPSIVDRVAVAFRCLKVHKALGQLPELHRTVLELRLWEQLPFEEIGRRTGRSEGAALQLYVRALAEMRALLREAGLRDADLSPESA